MMILKRFQKNLLNIGPMGKYFPTSSASILSVILSSREDGKHTGRLLVGSSSQSKIFMKPLWHVTSWAGLHFLSANSLAVVSVVLPVLEWIPIPSGVTLKISSDLVDGFTWLPIPRNVIPMQMPMGTKVCFSVMFYLETSSSKLLMIAICKALLLKTNNNNKFSRFYSQLVIIVSFY